MQAYGPPMFDECQDLTVDWTLPPKFRKSVSHYISIKIQCHVANGTVLKQAAFECSIVSL